jgi:hypothetical protein
MKRDWFLPLLVAAFFASQIPAILGHRYPYWDEAVYLSIGKFVYSAGTSGLWEPIRPLAFPAIIGFFWKLRLPYLIAAELVSVAFGIGCIILTYLLSKKLFGFRTGAVASILLAASPSFFYFSGMIFTEIPSAFFVLLSVYFFSRQKYALSGVSAGIATLFKFTNGLLIFALSFGFLILSYLKPSKVGLYKPFLKAAVSFAAILAPFLIFNAYFYRNFASNLLSSAFTPFIQAAWHQSNPTKAIPGFFQNYFFYIFQLIQQHIAFILLPVAIFLFWKKKWYLSPGKLVLGVVMAFYFLYFSVIINKDIRFLLTFLPIACIFAAAAFSDSFDYFRKNPSSLRSLSLVALLALLVVSVAISGYNDKRTLNWRAFETTEDTRLYNSISDLGIRGSVMTSDPVFAVYNNNLFIPYYDSSKGMSPHLAPSWQLQKNQKPFEAVVFSPESLYCSLGDLTCWVSREELGIEIKLAYTQEFSGSFFENTTNYYIYVNDSEFKQVISS